VVEIAGSVFFRGGWWIGGSTGSIFFREGWWLGDSRIITCFLLRGNFLALVLKADDRQ
jgi:hypothetical protein